MDKKTQTIETYNATALEMAKKFKDLGARVVDIDKGFSLVKKQNPAVLEIGCGDGRDASEILKRTNDYIGVDISSSMILIASKYVSRGNFVIADIEQYTFPSNLDLIFSFASLLHSDKEALREIFKAVYDALNDSGIFYVSLKYGEYGEVTKVDEFGTRTYYLYSPEDLTKISENLFEIIEEDIYELRGQKWFTIIFKKIV